MTLYATADTLEEADDVLSQASSLAFCDACFRDTVSKLIQLSELPKSGVNAPVVRSEPKRGKLLVEVDVCSSKLPAAAHDKERIFLEAVDVTMDALRCAFELPEPLTWPDLEKWIRIEFFDLGAAVKATGAKRVIAIHENRNLVLI